MKFNNIYNLSKLSCHDRKHGKRGMHLVLNRKQFSHVNLRQFYEQCQRCTRKTGDYEGAH